MLKRKKKDPAVEKVETTTKEELKRARKREQRQALKKPSLWPIIVMVLFICLGGILWAGSIVSGSRDEDATPNEYTTEPDLSSPKTEEYSADQF